MNVPIPAQAAPASSPIPHLTLATGAPIPVLGFGTYKIAPADAYDAVSRALDAGYRHIDTAQMYGNEAEVGAALAASGIAREELFVITNPNEQPDRSPIPWTGLAPTTSISCSSTGPFPPSTGAT